MIEPKKSREQRELQELVAEWVNKHRKIGIALMTVGPDEDLSGRVKVDFQIVTSCPMGKDGRRDPVCEKIRKRIETVLTVCFKAAREMVLNHLGQADEGTTTVKHHWYGDTDGNVGRISKYN